MYHSGSRCMTPRFDLEFTEHAADCFSERVSPLMLHHNIVDRPLLSELNSDAYNDVEQLVKNTFPNCNVSQIRLVCAPQLYGMYMLRKEEMNLTIGQNLQEKLLFHVTTESRAMESLDCGLDWRRTRRNKFGRGVSFSDDADYANYYANKTPSEAVPDDTAPMYSHGGYRSKVSPQRSSRFTAHAAVQLQRRHNSSTSGRYDGGRPLLEDLTGHNESVKLERLVHETFPKCNFNLIQVVNAPQMYGMYLLRKEEMRYGDRELILYHVTTKSRALESLKSGLDWRRTRRSKFGCGVSFSDDADYANYYADHSPKEGSRVIIVCAVLVNKIQRVSGNRNLIVPSGGADTTVSSNGRVYVKYNDYDFYPLYLMHYQRAPEHLNESKYFRNNPRNKIQQNNRVMQQQQQELTEQREREQAQRQQELRAQQNLRTQLEREQKWREQNLEARQFQQELRRQEQEQARRRLERDQEQVYYNRQAQAARQRESNSSCLIL